MDSMDWLELVMGIYLVFTVIKGSGSAYECAGLNEENKVYAAKKLRIWYAVCAALCFLEYGVHRITALADYDGIIGAVCSFGILGILAGIIIWLKRLEKNQ